MNTAYYFDHVITLTLLSDDKKVPTIKIPESSGISIMPQYKPGIEFSVAYLPGLLCHQCTVKITNLSPTVDIMLYNRMEIVAGYRYYDTVASEKFKLPIFTKYRVSPNPDGITVIQGLLLGEVRDLFSPGSYGIKNVPTEMKVKDFINQYLLGAAGVEVEDGAPKNITVPTFSVINKLPDTINESMITPGRSSSFKTRWEMVTHVEQVLASHVASEKMGGHQLVFEIYNDYVHIGLQEGEATQPQVTEKTVKLQYVTTIEFNGALLDITCPYIPGLVPGRLVKVNPKYYAGPDIPEVLTPQTFEVDTVPTLSALEKKEGFQLFRILTMKLSFSTEEENTMVLTCLPWSLLAENPSLQNEAAIEYEKLRPSIKETPLLSYLANVNKEWYPVLQYSLKGTYVGKDVQCKLGDTYIRGIRQIYQNEALYKWLQDYDGKSVGSIASDGSLVFQYGKHLYVSTDCLWVIAMKMTYDNSQQNKEMYYVNPGHPLSLRPFKYATYPEISGSVEDKITALTPDKELFKAVGDILKDKKKYIEAVDMYNMYILLGGTL